MILTNCRYIITQDEKRSIFENQDIFIVNNKIAEIGKSLTKKHPKEKKLDCSERIVMPGLINAHTHLGMSGMRGLKDDAQLNDWLKVIIEAEHKRTKKQIEEEVLLGMREALRTGTTTVCDMYDPADIAVIVAKKLGIRLVNTPAFFTAHRKLSREDIPTLLPDTGKCITITQGLGPHSIYGTDEKFLRAVREYATEHNLLIHIHVAETRKERVECKTKTGMLPVEYLEHIGFLGPDVLMAHSVWLTKGELDTIAKHKTKIVHCPQSNMKLAGGGVMPLREMQERNIVVALGTDSTASNNSMDMFREMHVCALLHKHHYWNPTTANAQTVLDLATKNGAEALQLDVGSIEEGKLADIITLNITDENLQPILKERIISHLVYAANGMNVSEVIINGRILLKERTFIENPT